MLIQPPALGAEISDADQRNAAAYHEAGHAVMAMCLGGHVNHEGVEIDERQYCGARFYEVGPGDQESILVLQALAGWRAEHLWHGRGDSRTCADEGVMDVLLDLRGGIDIDECDDVAACLEMLRAMPSASDADLAERYAEFSRRCYAILKQPVVWGAVEAVALELVARGKLSGVQALEAVGGSTLPLVEALDDAELALIAAA